MSVLKLVLLSLAASLAAADDTCPAWHDWRDWSDCTWFPLNDIRQTFVSACDVSIDMDKVATMPPLPGMPDKCGHCSFKMRCRKRPQADGCRPLDVAGQTCHEFTDVCDMPPVPFGNLGCRHELAPYYLRQCANRPDIPEWGREAYLDMFDLLPKFHCTKCKCCCHPYEPSEDGSTCEEKPVPTCDEFGEFNDWSDKCMWFPPDEMRADLQEHCDFQVKESDKAKSMYKKLLKMPEGFQQPDRCGYCSFKVRCRKRSPMSADGKKECFPLDAEKKACGQEDCDTCASACALPKVMGSCNYNEEIKKIVGPAIRSRMKKMPHGMHIGLMKMFSHLPHGKCVEKDGQCKCCCHPYEPSEDGETCNLKQVCKTPEDLGVEFDLNLPSDTPHLCSQQSKLRPTLQLQITNFLLLISLLNTVF